MNGRQHDRSNDVVSAVPSSLSPATPTLQLRGQARLRRSGESDHVLERRDAALLAVLVVEGPQSRTRLARLLWPDAEPSRALNNLRQRLFRLRRAAGTAVVTGGETVSLDQAVGHDLTPDMDDSDADLLATHDYSDNEALAERIEAMRVHWRHRRAERQQAQAQRHEDAGELELALPLAERLVARQPASEHHHRRLMRLHYLRGDRAAALAAYRRCEALLQERLGIAPGDETQALRMTIERSGTPVPPELAPLPVSLQRPPRLVGRAHEWQLIEEAWHAGRPVLVAGEPGIGKSRLLAEVASARAGSVRVGARPDERVEPYALLGRLLHAVVEARGAPPPGATRDEWARLLPGLCAPPATALRTTRLHAALIDGLRQAAVTARLTLVIDDLQFADDASLDALLALAGHCMEPRWLFAVRAHERPPRLDAWLDQGGAGRIEELALGALRPADVAELIQSLGLPGVEAQDWAGPLWRHAGGSPMLTLETLGACARGGELEAGRPVGPLPVPRHIGSLIDRRFQQLSEAARRLAQIAALAGVDFSVSLAARVLQANPVDLATAWRELEAAQVLRDAVFAHDLVREAVLRSVPAAIARELHAQLAMVAADLGAPAARVAQHWLRAQKWIEAADASLAAADDARRLSCRREESYWLAEAMEALRHVSDRARLFATQERRVACALAIDPFDVRLAQAEALLAMADGAAQRCTALLAMSQVFSADDQHGAAAALAGEARQLAALSADPDRDMALACVQAEALTRDGRGSEALAALQPFREAAFAGVAPAHARLLLDLGRSLLMQDRFSDARLVLERGQAIAERHADHVTTAEAIGHLGWVDVQQARVGDATRRLEQARRLHLASGGTLVSLGRHAWLLWRHYREVGRFAESLEMLETVAAEGDREGASAATSVADQNLALCYLQLGQPARALQALGRPLPSSVGESVRQGLHYARARIERWAGRPFEHHLREGRDMMANEGHRYYRAVWMSELALGLPGAEGVALALELLEEYAGSEYAYVVWALRLAACDRLTAAGQVAPAAGLARQMLAECETRVPTWHYAGEAWWIVAQALRAAGDQALQAEAVSRGVRWIRAALPHVPEAFRDSFLHRNPFNRLLVSAACGTGTDAS